MSRIIILNGPIGCGKDTIGGSFADREGYNFTAFKEPMFRIAASTLGLDYDSFLSYYADREWKDSPNERLNGRTVRELMIHISEVYVKPFLGSDYFGQQALTHVNTRTWQNTFVFSDGGFQAEIEVLAESHEVILVHMYRDGCTFENDSRSYVLTNAVPRIYTLTNNGTVQEGVDALGRILDDYEDSREQSEPVASSEATVARPARVAQRRRGGASGRVNSQPDQEPASISDNSQAWRGGNRFLQAASQFGWTESNGRTLSFGSGISGMETEPSATDSDEVADNPNRPLPGISGAAFFMDEAEPVS